MKVLAVNTANMLLSLALAEDGKIVEAFESPETRDQGNLLLRHIRDALAKQNWRYEDLGLLAVVTGPGSFTGIRIGIATMRGLALAAKVPMVGLSSFDLCAAPQQGMINLIAIESWRDELYFEGRDEKGEIVIPPCNMTPEEFAASLKPADYILSGDAALKLHEALPAAALSSYIPRAGDVARVGEQLFRAKGPERPVPYYLREADVTVAKAK